MEKLTTKILKYVERFPEGTPVVAKALLHLGTRAAIDQALCRLARRGQLRRTARGVYRRPVVTRFGTRSLSVEEAIQELTEKQGIIVSKTGAASANSFGLTTQVPTRATYLTTGRNQKLWLGKQVVELKNAPKWQLVLHDCLSGDAIRALEWLGESNADEAIGILRKKLPESERKKLPLACSKLPVWLAKEVGRLADNG